ncbi:MAG: ABC transporter ATP-binding protein [Alphaproteobacteria bacterium]|nr:ABC transporter ATP-binding protein [Alphaproteobacteria bacterium]
MTELLALEGLSAGWGAARVLEGVSFRLAEGQSLALLGRNGMGKTTLLCALLGVAATEAGRISFAGQDITRLAPERRAWAGLGWVPQERNIFRSLTVEENLTAVARPGPWSPERAWSLFPRLKERRRNMGNPLSGGEQQMLAIARALVLNPRLLLLDEPTEGLAPIIVEELLAVLHRLVREEGMAAIIVEQHARKVLDVTDRAVILERGMVVHDGDSVALAKDSATLERYLGVGSSQ